MATNSDIARAGWMYRQSSLLHRWKRNWFTLDKLGDLRYFESQDSPRAEDRIVLRAQVAQIKTGADVSQHTPPEGVSAIKCAFMELMMTNNDKMILCCDTYDDMKAWHIAMEEARTMYTAAPGGATNYVTAVGPGILPVYGGYGGYVGYGGYGGYGGFGGGYYGPSLYTPPSYPGQVISTPGTQTQVITTPMPMGGGPTVITARPAHQIIMMDDDPYRYRGHYGFGHRRHRFNDW